MDRQSRRREGRSLHAEQKEACYRALGDSESADATRQARLFPPRPAATDAKQIDLSAHYNASLYDGSGWSRNATDNLARLPHTFESLKGAGFDLRGIVQLPRSFKLKTGDEQSGSDAPTIAGRGLLLEGKVESGKLNGVIVAQGGNANGYALILKDGVLQFLTRVEGELTSVASTAPQRAPGFTFRAEMSAEGEVTLAIDGKQIASGKVSPVKEQPGEGLQAGSDNGGSVGDYDGEFAFEGVISLTLTVLAAEESNRRSAQATGIKISQKAPAVHFLTSCQWGRETRSVEVASFVMHYADGTSETLPVKFLDDVADWYPKPNESIPDAQVGWRGSNAAGPDIVLSELVWQNPHPEKAIASIDFISAKAKAAPFLVGITLE